eukprot:NODE_35503_length_253_cov_3.690476.p2 GENE.NODE_35503_length_253_cov_3.690476~~NODE_35503_length_253_cov_3.690476.p2  ORF type:complete len:50 (-),score=2.16 NODE_35503_length_253_cov_3.690476:51-200(-)
MVARRCFEALDSLSTPPCCATRLPQHRKIMRQRIITAGTSSGRKKACMR